VVEKSTDLRSGLDDTFLFRSGTNLLTAKYAKDAKFENRSPRVAPIAAAIAAVFFAQHYARRAVETPLPLRERFIFAIAKHTSSDAPAVFLSGDATYPGKPGISA